jgi:ArsR family transcriptional regulator
MATSSLSREVTHLHANFCSALADPKRILLLYALADNPHTVNALSTDLGLSQPATSRHLKVLRERGLVNATRRGQCRIRASDARLIQALDLLRLVLRMISPAGRN